MYIMLIEFESHELHMHAALVIYVCRRSERLHAWVLILWWVVHHPIVDVS